jgi:hypothetical protein
MPAREPRRDPNERLSAHPPTEEGALRRPLGGNEPLKATESDTGLLGGVDEANEDVDALDPEVPLEKPEEL